MNTNFKSVKDAKALIIQTTNEMRTELNKMRSHKKVLEKERISIGQSLLPKSNYLEAELKHIDNLHLEAKERIGSLLLKFAKDTPSKASDFKPKLDADFGYSIAHNFNRDYHIANILGLTGSSKEDSLHFQFLFHHEKVKEILTEVINGIPDSEWPSNQVVIENPVDRLVEIDKEIKELIAMISQLENDADSLGIDIGQ